jgi:pimeloyl-ACP methyl ester carboxylesterase
VTGDYRFVELPGVTHWIPEQAPRELATAVLDRIATG